MSPVRLQRVGPLWRLGNGDVGGKARSLQFLTSLIGDPALAELFRPHQVAVPETTVLGTDLFEQFIAKNALSTCLDEGDDDRTLRRFLAGAVAEPVVKALRGYLATHVMPLAVRSSSLNEDAFHHPMAGLFRTVMLPNNAVDPEARLLQLLDAVRLVYASAYSQDAGQYLALHGLSREREHMAVILQDLVGQTHGPYFFPHISGTAQSLNYFPVGSMRPDDGVANIVLGLGSRAVQGNDGLRFCPRYPSIRPKFRETRDLLTHGQIELDALDLRLGDRRLTGDKADTVVAVPIGEAGDEALALVASTLDPETGILTEGTFRPGVRVLTFNRVLDGSVFPLARGISRLLEITRAGYGAAVELELAVDLTRGRSRLFLVQARPMPTARYQQAVVIPEVPEDRLLLSTDLVLGHGSLSGIRAVIYVDPDSFDAAYNHEIAGEVAVLNRQMVSEGTKYLLIGPGRWGSCNPEVGIPVTYPQIQGARLIAELGAGGVHVEPSQGTHFFHNLVASNLLYLMASERRDDHINLAWLRAQPNRARTRHARLIFLEEGATLSARVDGERRRGVVFREE